MTWDDDPYPVLRDWAAFVALGLVLALYAPYCTGTAHADQRCGPHSACETDATMRRCDADQTELATLRPLLLSERRHATWLQEVRLPALQRERDALGARLEETARALRQARSALPGYAWMALGGGALLVVEAVVLVLALLQ